MAPGFVRLARLGPPPGGQMTRTMNSRIAGFTFLLFIAAGVTGMVLSSQATGGEGIAAQLATIARHATDVRITCPPGGGPSRASRTKPGAMGYAGAQPEVARSEERRVGKEGRCRGAPQTSQK